MNDERPLASFAQILIPPEGSKRFTGDFGGALLIWLADRLLLVAKRLLKD